MPTPAAEHPLAPLAYDLYVDDLALEPDTFTRAEAAALLATEGGEVECADCNRSAATCPALAVLVAPVAVPRPRTSEAMMAG